MNLPHIHLLLNHFPTVGFSIGLALLVAAIFAKSDDLKRASLVLIFLIALVTIAVYVSGNAALDRICPTGGECLPGVSVAAITVHENGAMLAYIFMEIAGLAAFLGLWQYRRTARFASWNVPTVLVLSLITFGLMAQAANIAGEIRHPEILEQGAAAAAAPVSSFQIAGLTRASIKGFVDGEAWVWPASEAIHFVGLCLLFSTVLLVDFRMLGMGKGLPFAALHKILPWGILGFGLNLLTGMLFFIAEPGQYTNNAMFFWKVVLILLAGINALYFLLFDEAWAVGAGDDAPLTAKFVAASAIFLWVGILFCGHMLPFLGNAF